MSFVVKKQSASDISKPPEYTEVDEDEVFLKGRENRSAKPEAYYRQFSKVNTSNKTLPLQETEASSESTATAAETTEYVLGSTDVPTATEVEYTDDIIEELSNIPLPDSADQSPEQGARAQPTAPPGQQRELETEQEQNWALPPPRRPPPPPEQQHQNTPVEQNPQQNFQQDPDPDPQQNIQDDPALHAQPNLVQPQPFQADQQPPQQQPVVPAAPQNPVPANPINLQPDRDSDSESEMESGSSSTIYPPNFKGTTAEDAETWLRHFKNYCAYKQYTDDKAKALFRVVLIDSAAVWYDSLDQAEQADWERLKTAFLHRYTTPEFLKYKHANSLFNHKQESKTVDDYIAYMQKLASQINATDQILRFAVINGLRPDIKNHVTMKQPTNWQELVTAARVGEMCAPASATQTDNSVAVQIELMRDQLNQLAVEKRIASINGPSRSNSQSRSSSERRVRFTDDNGGERFDQRRRSLSPPPAWRRRDDRRGDERGRYPERDRFDASRRSSSGSNSRYDDNRRGSGTMRMDPAQDEYYAGSIPNPNGMRYYGYREAPPPQFQPPQRPPPPQNEWRQGQAPQWGRGRGRGRGEYRGQGRGSFRGFRGRFRGNSRGRGGPPRFQDENSSCFKCGRGRHQHPNMCPAINQNCRGCGRKGHFLRVCRTSGAPVATD